MNFVSLTWQTALWAKPLPQTPHSTVVYRIQSIYMTRAPTTYIWLNSLCEPDADKDEGRRIKPRYLSLPPSAFWLYLQWGFICQSHKYENWMCFYSLHIAPYMYRGESNGCGLSSRLAIHPVPLKEFFRWFRRWCGYSAELRIWTDNLPLTGIEPHMHPLSVQLQKKNPSRVSCSRIQK